jgi:hypothetical protein
MDDLAALRAGAVYADAGFDGASSYVAFLAADEGRGGPLRSLVPLPRTLRLPLQFGSEVSR